MNKPAVATPSDYRDVVEVLATAFAQDGVFSALLPDARSRTARLRRFFEIDASPWALEHGHSWILRDGREPLGAAVILPSADRHDPAENHPVTIARYLRIFGRRSLQARDFNAELERVHPVEEHLYLPFIGAAQPSRGVGAMLMSAMAGAADEAGLPIYLEASSAASARLYRRHGFVDTGVIEVPDMPVLYPMWREPSTP